MQSSLIQVEAYAYQGSFVVRSLIRGHFEMQASAEILRRT